MAQDIQPTSEAYHPRDVVFINTHLIQRAMEGLQKSREKFQALLEQAELGELSVQYDLALRYLEGDGVEADPVQAVHWLSQAAELGDLRALETVSYTHLDVYKRQGYTCGDLFFQLVLQQGARDALADVLRDTAGLPLLFVLGLPLTHGGKLYNCAAVCQNRCV